MNRLDAEVARYVARGYQLVSRSEHEALLAYQPNIGAFLWRWFWLGPFMILFWPKGHALRIGLNEYGEPYEQKLEAHGPSRSKRLEREPIRWQDVNGWLLAATVLVWFFAILLLTLRP